MIEVWRPLPFDRRYEVSSQGRVRSYIRRGMKIPGRQCTEPVILECPKDRRTGYRVVRISDPADPSGKRKKWYVHQLVMLVFAGPRPEGCRDIRHLDGDPENNRLGNLAYGTVKENAMDKAIHGHTTSPLSAQQVREIRNKAAEGLSRRDLAEMFQVTPETIRNIETGRSWAWLDAQ